MSPPLQVVKLGGSLQDDPWLPRWLEALAAQGAGRVVIVPGGGRFADAARQAQARWGFGDLPAHNLAVLGMAQMAQLFAALQPGLTLVREAASVRGALARRGVPVWQALDLLRDAPDELTNWDTTSDSLALWLGQQLRAASVWLVKACAVPEGTSIAELSRQGIVDRALPGRSEGWPGRLRVLHAATLDAVLPALSGGQLQT